MESYLHHIPADMQDDTTTHDQVVPAYLLLLVLFAGLEADVENPSPCHDPTRQGRPWREWGRGWKMWPESSPSTHEVVS